MLVWNYNVQFELLLGFGIKDVTVEYSVVDGIEWMSLGDVELAQGTARADYVANTVVPFDGVAGPIRASDRQQRLGLDGAKWRLQRSAFHVASPASAREPQPADAATNVSVDTNLVWAGGPATSSHTRCIFGNRPPRLWPWPARWTVPASPPGALDLGVTYYWQITEVQDAESWTGRALELLDPGLSRR